MRSVSNANTNKVVPMISRQGKYNSEQKLNTLEQNLRSFATLCIDNDYGFEMEGDAIYISSGMETLLVVIDVQQPVAQHGSGPFVSLRLMVRERQVALTSFAQNVQRYMEMAFQKKSQSSLLH